jgi:hypothetical protein
MNPLHLDTLVALRSSGDIGLPVGTLLTDLRRGRHPHVAEPDLRRALRDLADQRLAAYEENPVVGRWRITAHGSSVLQEAGV